MWKCKVVQQCDIIRKSPILNILKKNQISSNHGFSVYEKSQVTSDISKCTARKI